MTVARVRGEGGCEPLCPEWIAAEGTITPETTGRFKDMFERIGAERLPVVIDSRGGDLDAALAIGRMIRERGLHTLVGTTIVFGCKPRDPDCNKGRPAARPYKGYAFTPGYCARECWFLFAGGIRRLGQWTSAGTGPAVPFSTGQKGRTTDMLIAEFLRDMGLSDLPLTVDRSRISADLAPYDDNRIIMFRLTNDPGATDQFAEPAACKRGPQPENCIRREPDAAGKDS